MHFINTAKCKHITVSLCLQENDDDNNSGNDDDDDDDAHRMCECVSVSFS